MLKRIGIAFVMLLAVLLSYSGSASALFVTPHLYNGDFELASTARGTSVAPRGYTGGGMGQMARVASGTDGVPAYSGSWMVRLSVPEGYAATQIYNPRPFAAPQAGAYNLSVALRSEGTQARAVMSIGFLDASLMPLAGGQDFPAASPPSGQWTVYAPAVTVPTGAAFLVVSVRNSPLPGHQGTSRLYVDALDLVPAPASKR